MMGREKTWSVYKHTFPNGKVYIGITSREPEKRWAGGSGYKRNDEMYKAILQYGWRNIRHEILAEGLSEEEARREEAQLILSYGAKGRDKTYNTSFALCNQSTNIDWFDKIVDEKTWKKHWLDFAKLDDAWMEPYIEQIGGYPFGSSFTEDGVEIDFYISDREYIERKVLLIKYPERDMSFREVYNWLKTKPKANIKKSERFKMPVTPELTEKNQKA